MKNYIVAAIDLGPNTEKVLSYASVIAERAGVAVKLFYVIDYLLTPPTYLSGYVEEERRRDESEMASWKSRLSEAGIKSESAVVMGRLHESFLKVLDEASPELLVIGHRSHLIRPSSSERLIKSLKVAMLVVRGQRAEGASLGSVGIRRILCPVDFSDNSRRAAAEATRYASLLSATLRLLHVVPSHHIKGKWSGWKGLAEKEREDFDRTVCTEADARLDSFRLEFGVDVAVVCQGNPGEQISLTAEKEKYDLIVMGGRGLSYIESVLVGSTAETVLKSSPCPVMIVH